MTNNEIALLINSKEQIDDKFAIWMAYYDILQSRGRILTTDNDGHEVSKS